MNNSTCLMIFVFLFTQSISAEEIPSEEELKQQCVSQGMTWNNWCNPSIVLNPELAKHIEVTDCKAVSGLTCRLTLLQLGKLPSKIFVQSKDIGGKPIGDEWRLIYPDLEANGWVSGVATFRGIMPGNEKGQSPFRHFSQILETLTSVL